MKTNDISNVTFVDNPDFNPSCAGNACADVSYRWDNGHYFSNRSSNRSINVNIKNWVASETIPLSPGEEKKSYLLAFENPF